jgi:hypothetical protein
MHMLTSNNYMKMFGFSMNLLFGITNVLYRLIYKVCFYLQEIQVHSILAVCSVFLQLPGEENESAPAILCCENNPADIPIRYCLMYMLLNNIMTVFYTSIS